MQRHLFILAQRIFPPVPTTIADELALLRVRQLQAHLPLLHLTMIIIVIAAASASVGRVPFIVSHLLPTIAIPICIYRGWMWHRQRKHRFTIEQAQQVVNQVRWSATGLIGLATAWSLLAWNTAGPEVAIYFPIFIAMGTMATAYSLATIRDIGLSVLAVGMLPISMQLLWHGEILSLAIAATLLMASLFLARMLVLHHNHLVGLIELQLRMKTLAETDPLTGLSNRRALMHDLRAEIRHAAKGGARKLRGPAVAMIDLDGFKPVNDCHGHAAGDAVLQQVAMRFDAACRDGAKIYRLGGDEFALLIPAASERSAEAIADGVMAVLARPFRVDNSSIVIGASLGMAIWPGDGHDADSLIALADSRLYLAKADHHRDSAQLAMRDQVTWAAA